MNGEEKRRKGERDDGRTGSNVSRGLTVAQSW